MTDLMPAIFFGHGNPINTLAKNAFTDGWAKDRQFPSPARASMAAPSPCLPSKSADAA
jgi:hypothetical protein